MARIPADSAETHVDLLRGKYAELCRKYAALVERLEQRSPQHSAMLRLGYWGLQTRSTALAMICGDRIELSNAHFVQLAAQHRGPWRGLDGAESVHNHLRALVLSEAAALQSEPASSSRERRFRCDDGGVVASLRSERVRHGNESDTLVLIQDQTQ